MAKPSSKPRGSIGAVSMTLPFTSASAGVVRRELVTWLTLRSSSEECLEDARLVATELVGNAVRHAQPLDPGVMHVGWHEEDGSLAISVTDGGAHTLPRQREPDAEDIGGRGLQIVDALATRWWIEELPGRNTVHALVAMLGNARLA